MLSYFALYGVVFMLGILLLMFQKKKKLSTSQKTKFIAYLGKIENISSSEQQIIESDKLYHNILKAYGYHGTFGEILKKKPSVIIDIQAIWNLHKLRNKLVHDLSGIDENILKKSSQRFMKEISRLIKQ